MRQFYRIAAGGSRETPNVLTSSPINNMAVAINWFARARSTIRRSRGACLACEAVVSQAKDRAGSPLCHALPRDEAEVLT
jgi:hypothetical protein